jgi:hypothetical protein
MEVWRRILSALRGPRPAPVPPAWEQVAVSLGGKVTIGGWWPISLIAPVADTLVSARISAKGETRVWAEVDGRRSTG